MGTHKSKLPATYGECQGACMPCPLVSCRYNTYLDVLPNGEIAFNYRDDSNNPTPIENLKEPNCVLHLADRTGVSDSHIKRDGNLKLAYIAYHLSVSRPRAEQICEEALRKLRPNANELRDNPA